MRPHRYGGAQRFQPFAGALQLRGAVLELLQRLVERSPAAVQLVPAEMQLIRGGVQIPVARLECFTPLAELLSRLVQLGLAVAQLRLILSALRLQTLGAALVPQGAQCLAKRLERLPIGVAVAVRGRVFHANACAHKITLERLAVKAVLRHKDVRCDRDHIGDVIRRLENAGDDKLFFLERVDPCNQLVLQADLLPEGERASIQQLFLHGAFSRPRGHAPVQQHRP